MDPLGCAPKVCPKAIIRERRSRIRTVALDARASHAVQGGYLRGLLDCQNERDLIDLGVCEEILRVDVSAEALAEAERLNGDRKMRFAVRTTGYWQYLQCEDYVFPAGDWLILGDDADLGGRLAALRPDASVDIAPRLDSYDVVVVHSSEEQVLGEAAGLTSEKGRLVRVEERAGSEKDTCRFAEDVRGSCQLGLPTCHARP
jgi:hypothetical protein